MSVNIPASFGNFTTRQRTRQFYDPSTNTSILRPVNEHVNFTTRQRTSSRDTSGRIAHLRFIQYQVKTQVTGKELVHIPARKTITSKQNQVGNNII